MTQKTRDVLIAARAIIADPAMWYQGDWSASGKIYDADEPCCAKTAIFRAGPIALACDAIRCAARATPDCVSLNLFNDEPTTTHADIMAVFDRAIAGEQAA